MSKFDWLNKIKSDLLVIAEVQQDLRCSRDTVYRYMREEGLPYEQYPGRRMVRQSDLQAWRDARREMQLTGDTNEAS